MQKFSLNPPATCPTYPAPALSLDQATLFILRLLSLCLCTLLIPHSSGSSISILHLLKSPFFIPCKDKTTYNFVIDYHWIIMLGHRDRDYASPHQHTYQELKHTVAMLLCSSSGLEPGHGEEVLNPLLPHHIAQIIPHRNPSGSPS